MKINFYNYQRLAGHCLFMLMSMCLLIGLSSCSSGPYESQVHGGSRTQSLSQDALGHRPGPRGFTTVIIDAGHGGRDSGAVSHGLSEKAVALDTAHRLKEKLKGKFKVVLVRSGDRFVSLDDRVEIANKYSSAILVSLHYNASRAAFIRGPETYYWRVDSHGLASRIQKNMEQASGGRYSGLGKKRRRLRLTRNSKIPSVLLEFGYLTNYSDARLVKSSAYRDRLASAVASAIITQSKIGDRGTGPLPKPINRPLSRSTDAPGS